MSAGPLRRRAILVALDARLECRRLSDLRQHRCTAAGVISGGRHVTDPEHIGLIFLVAGKAKQPHLRKLLGALGNQSTEGGAADDGAEDLAEHSKYRIGIGR